MTQDEFNKFFEEALTACMKNGRINFNKLADDDATVKPADDDVTFIGNGKPLKVKEGPTTSGKAKTKASSCDKDCKVKSSSKEDAGVSVKVNISKEAGTKKVDSDPSYNKDVKGTQDSKTSMNQPVDNFERNEEEDVRHLRVTDTDLIDMYQWMHDTCQLILDPDAGSPTQIVNALLDSIPDALITLQRVNAEETEEIVNSTISKLERHRAQRRKRIQELQDEARAEAQAQAKAEKEEAWIKKVKEDPEFFVFHELFHPSF